MVKRCGLFLLGFVLVTLCACGTGGGTQPGAATHKVNTGLQAAGETEPEPGSAAESQGSAWDPGAGELHPSAGGEAAPEASSGAAEGTDQPDGPETGAVPSGTGDAPEPGADPSGTGDASEPGVDPSGDPQSPEPSGSPGMAEEPAESPPSLSASGSPMPSVSPETSQTVGGDVTSPVDSAEPSAPPGPYSQQTADTILTVTGGASPSYFTKKDLQSSAGTVLAAYPAGSGTETVFQGIQVRDLLKTMAGISSYRQVTFVSADGSTRSFARSAVFTRYQNDAGAACPMALAWSADGTACPLCLVLGQPAAGGATQDAWLSQVVEIQVQP